METIAGLAERLERGETTARALVETALARALAPEGEGGRTFITLYAARARAAADAADRLRAARLAPSPFTGIPIALKDLFDVAGEPTRAGSRLLADAPPAPRHAAIVARLLGAGFIPLGRVNMSEFAYSGLGLNPHYGTPRSPWQREVGRIPGGSSSGSAVAVADGMAAGAIGTDTGGSCRIPAAFCGVVGFKPTQARVPLAGTYPLAPSLDSVGPLARSVACCAILDAVMAGEPPLPLPLRPLSGLRLGLPRGFALEELEPEVAAAFEAALGRIAAAGAVIHERRFAPFEEIPQVAPRGALLAVEAWAHHRERLARRRAEYDPRVAARIEGGAQFSGAEVVALYQARRRLQAEMAAADAECDALILPTVPILPPPVALLEADEPAYWRATALASRNTAPVNFLDRPAVSLPCHAPGAPPAGLMLVGKEGGDRALLALAAAIEAVLPERD